MKAVSSSLRLQVLDMLFDRGPLTYTEIMNILRLNPSRDAGRFAYHLKFLIKADLIESDAEAKKYRLTDLGRMLVEVAETVEEHSFKRRKMMVRTSRLAMEEFDRNKIAEALVKEANVPQDLAQKIARETEGRLLEVKTKYLTAPLIREFVNAILIEKGLEEFRHKLTRLGLPVYDVTQLIRSAGAKTSTVNAVHESAGDSVIEEYTLLNVLPRDIADAHLSGSLHLNNLGVWILKPSEFAHDLRFFFKHGLQFSKPQLAAASSPPPKSFEEALATIRNLLRIGATEIQEEQLLDYFNVFLAPFTEGAKHDRILANLRLFISNLNQTMATQGSTSAISVGLELTIPDFLKDEHATGPGGKRIGTYADYAKESQSLATLLLDAVVEESKRKPVLQPNIIVKVRPQAFQSDESQQILYTAHKLATERGIPLFANLNQKGQTHLSYTSMGSRFTDNWRGDWELDTMRMGVADSVLVNLPRIAYESEGKMAAFHTLLNEQFEMALRAMEIKYQTIKLRAREGLLPFLTNKSNGEQYSRFENFSRLIGFVGLNEAAESLGGKPSNEDANTLDLTEQVLKYVEDNVGKSVKKPESRPVTAMIPCTSTAKRLARLDIERYGWARVHVKGTKDQPFYSDVIEINSQAKRSFNEQLKTAEKIQQLTPGGHLALIEIDGEAEPDKLLAVSKQIVSETKIGLYAFNRAFAYCSRCQRIISGHPTKCPSCGSVDYLTTYRRVSGRYAPDEF